VRLRRAFHPRCLYNLNEPHGRRQARPHRRLVPANMSWMRSDRLIVASRLSARSSSVPSRRVALLKRCASDRRHSASRARRFLLRLSAQSIDGRSRRLMASAGITAAAWCGLARTSDSRSTLGRRGCAVGGDGAVHRDPACSEHRRRTFFLRLLAIRQAAAGTMTTDPLQLCGGDDRGQDAAGRCRCPS
jgi:hypothetical protein